MSQRCIPINMADDIYEKFSRSNSRSLRNREKSCQISQKKHVTSKRPKTHLGLSREMTKSVTDNEKSSVCSISNTVLVGNVKKNMDIHVYDLNVSGLSSRISSRQTSRTRYGDTNLIKDFPIRLRNDHTNSHRKYTTLKMTNQTQENKKITYGNVSPLTINREAVVNVIYEGHSDHHTSNTNKLWNVLDKSYLMDGLTTASVVRTTGHINSAGAYPVYFEDDITRDASCLQDTPFIYQKAEFENFIESVPLFVWQDIKKNGRLVTETLILRLNYLRRRRQLGETNTSVSRQSGDILVGHQPGDTNILVK